MAIKVGNFPNAHHTTRKTSPHSTAPPFWEFSALAEVSLLPVQVPRPAQPPLILSNADLSGNSVLKQPGISGQLLATKTRFLVNAGAKEGSLVRGPWAACLKNSGKMAAQDFVKVCFLGVYLMALAWSNVDLGRGDCFVSDADAQCRSWDCVLEENDFLFFSPEIGCF